MELSFVSTPRKERNKRKENKERKELIPQTERINFDWVIEQGKKHESHKYGYKALSLQNDLPLSPLFVYKISLLFRLPTCYKIILWCQMHRLIQCEDSRFFLSVTLPGDLLARAKLWCRDEFWKNFIGRYELSKFWSITQKVQKTRITRQVFYYSRIQVSFPTIGL